MSALSPTSMPSTPQSCTQLPWLGICFISSLLGSCFLADDLPWSLSEMACQNNVEISSLLAAFAEGHLRTTLEAVEAH